MHIGTYAAKALACSALLIVTSVAFAAAPSPDEARSKIRELNWIRGPGTGSLGAKATIDIPKDGGLLNASDGSKFLELTGNLPSPGTNIVVGGNWWAAFDFVDEGYVPDDDKIDAEALLKTLKAGDAPANEQRRKLGLTEMYTDGWYVPPHYDTSTKHLEWGLKIRSPGSDVPTINYTVRMLGRSGHESAVLVSSPDQLDTDVRSFKAVLSTFKFVPGEKYSEFKQGDKVAAYGLGALVVGGAAAVAAKTGLWKVLLGFLAAFWKLIAVAVVAALAGVAKLFGRRASKP